MPNPKILFYPIDTVLVKKLIKTQFPKWSNLPVSLVESSGHDNRTFHLGDKMLVRLPSAEGYAAQVQKEQSWLPQIASQLSLQIPRPIAMGIPSSLFPWHWSVYEWIDGVNAEQADLNATQLEKLALQLAIFLNELHQVDTLGAPLAGVHNFYRGAHLSVYDKEAKEAISQLQAEIETKNALALWEQALQTAWSREPVWVHGDLASSNMLVSNKQLVAMIDFGCMGIGDPACDLVIAWTYLDASSREKFKDNLNLDPDTWARARGWVLWKAAITLAAMNDKSSIEAVKQKSIIQRVVSEFMAV